MLAVAIVLPFLGVGRVVRLIGVLGHVFGKRSAVSFQLSARSSNENSHIG